MSEKTPPVIKFINEYESIFRFSRSRLIWPETLLQHAGEVAIIGGYLMDMTGAFTPEEYAEFMRRALTHDMEEIVTGDIARPTKYANEELKNKLKELERISAKQVVEHYELPKEWLHSWSHAKEGKIGWVLKIADCATVLMTCYREIGLVSNKSFEKVGLEALKFAKELLEELNTKLENTVDSYIYSQLYGFLHRMCNLVESTITGDHS
jgi:5'-deoxynucleotidase